MAHKMHKRPTHRELEKKLREAKEAICAHQVRFVSIDKTKGELDELEIGSSKEVWSLLLILLQEISPEHYVGGKPPQKSYEKTILGKELFAFSWESRHLGTKMYLKFALKDEVFVYVSLHTSRLNED